MAITPSTYRAAAEYMARGYVPVPIPLRRKGPSLRGWQTVRPCAEDLPGMFPDPSNIGLLLGAASRHLTDVDLDCSEALALAPRFLPPTHSIFGRVSRPMSHFFYTCQGAVKELYSDPLARTGIVELRTEGRDGGGHQTVVPPSIHPSGERVEWFEDAEPATVSPELLGRSVARLAVGVLLMRYAPDAPPDAPEDVAITWLDGVDRRLSQAARVWLGVNPAAFAPEPRREPYNGTVDLAELAEALDAVPNGELHYDDWVRVGLALKAASGESGIGLWEHWSAKASKNDPAVTARKWATFRPSTIHAETIFYLARQHGWKPERERVRSRPIPPINGHTFAGDDKQKTTEENKPSNARILTGADFVASFVPPDWLIDGLVQSGRLYACTSPTGHGKTAVWLYNACMIQAGRKVANLETEFGNVVILAGENPEDLKARMLGMMGAFNLTPKQLPYVLPGTFPLDESGAEQLLIDIEKLGIPLVLIIGDTASSFFPGDDENSNVQAGNYARIARTLTAAPGNPAVIMISHPVKNASRENLLPRGGGAFLNELDGNFILWAPELGELTSLHWQGKIRGPDFDPLSYILKPVPTGKQDKKGHDVMTVIARPVDDFEAASHAAQVVANEDAVLRTLCDHPDWSMAEMARSIGWVSDKGEPEKWRVQRALKNLANDKLARKFRGKWRITDAGEKEAQGDRSGSSDSGV